MTLGEWIPQYLAAYKLGTIKDNSYDTLTRESGADLRVVMELLGHTDIKTTARYSHADLTSMETAVQNYRSSILLLNSQFCH